ncbi:thioredoxin family protein [Cytophagaceae bacterium DM2B3-1]|uniref:Thioredoxin family protein n=1 Tax=Xanthocytophaga flava TaxID=3048013 RepID=A0ABT7CLW1_9BACT|nr:thioredoxin family protein [Xanthocytophaga flavus]MDJ1469500.1 thioredoxin family protein [Xanthocytophaga flavus]MDJ1493987.1 thioredoxin family protein [Xanthocytophaga flavus]
MKSVLLTFLVCVTLVVSTQTYAQEKPKLYNPEANAQTEIQNAVKKAQAEGKHVFLQIGGNWCSWCLKFNKFSTTDTQLDSLFKASYVIVHVNYSKENQNLPTLEKLSYPQRFGFPVFVILNDKGDRIHTQNSAYLEKGDGYDKEKVFDFLSQWTKASLDPKHYQKKAN